MSVQCWPEGHGTRNACENEIPDVDNATLSRFGWGFVFARDDGSPTGEGAFYACPEHRSDLTEDGRDAARNLYAVAKALAALQPHHRQELLGEAVREGGSLVLRDVRNAAIRRNLQRKGLLVDRMYSTELTPLGELVRAALQKTPPALSRATDTDERGKS